MSCNSLLQAAMFKRLQLFRKTIALSSGDKINLKNLKINNYIKRIIKEDELNINNGARGRNRTGMEF